MNVSVDPIAALKCRCERCGHEWLRRGEKLPAQCPRCKSAIWQKVREEKAKETKES